MVEVEIKLHPNEVAAIVEGADLTFGPNIVIANCEENIRGYVRAWERAGHSVRWRMVQGRSFRATSDAEMPGEMAVMGGLRLSMGGGGKITMTGGLRFDFAAVMADLPLPKSPVCQECWRYKVGLCADPDSSTVCDLEDYRGTDGDEYYEVRR